MFKRLLWIGGVLTCCVSMSSCDKVKDMLSSGDEKNVSSERRAGLGIVKSSSVSEIKQWLDEPNVLVVVGYHGEG